MGQLSREQIAQMGFASVGDHVFLSDKASFHNCRNIHLGSRVRIDDFCVLAAGEGGIHIGQFIHIGVGSSLIGRGRIQMDDFSGLSSRVSVYSSSDDYSGSSLTNPMVPDEYKQVRHADVYLGRHVIVGAGSVILPGAVLEEGVAVGALSMVDKPCPAFGVYFGNPARRIADRKRDLLMLEAQLLGRRQP